MSYSPYKAAGAATNWMEDYFKLSNKQKEAIALGKQQKGKTRIEFSKELREIQEKQAKAHSKRKKGFFEKLVGDIAPMVLSAFFPIAGGALMGMKKGYDIDQQGKHTSRRSQWTIDAINKTMPGFAGTFIKPESTLAPIKDSMIERRDAANEMRDPLSILAHSAVEGVKGYAMGKAVKDVGSDMFTSQGIDKAGYSVDPTWASTGAAGLKTGATAFTPFKALAGGGFKDLLLGKGDDDSAALLMYLLSSIAQEGMEG